VLTFAYVISFADRTVISLLIDPIKADLSLSDTQIALLQGLAFGIFYTLMGLPLGWLADRVSRRSMIAVGASVWCTMTAACGLAQSFGHLFLARVGVGAGEASLSPAALSIISDYFPRERRGLPIGVYTMASASGAGIALIIGGVVIDMVADADRLVLPLLGEVARWQAAFIIVGLIGLVIVPLIATVAEPTRRNELAVNLQSGGLLEFIRRHPAFVLRHYGGVALFGIVIYGVLSWVPAYFIRTFGWSPTRVGLTYGPVLLVFGGAGTVVGGWVATKLARRGIRDAVVWVTGLGMMLTAIPMAMVGIASTPAAALMWLAPALLLMTSPGGTAIQAIQEAVPNHTRGQASAVYYLVISIVGLTLGPLSVALLTDYVFMDGKSTGTAIAIVAGIVAPLAGALGIAARRPFRVLLGEEPGLPRLVVVKDPG
jgi:MFS family permease